MLKLPKISNVVVFTGAYLIIIGSLFFTATSAYQYCIQRPDFVKWSSPDETANYFFSKLYAQTGQLSVSNQVRLPEASVVKPRSFRAPQGLLEPISFVGLPVLYGFIAKLSSIAILPYLTPLFGVLGLWFLFGLIKRLFNYSTAIVATTLAAAFPVYMYYSARSMFHNILFISCCLGGLYFGLRALGQARLSKYQSPQRWSVLLWLALSGVFFGWSLVTRTSELLWLAPVFAIFIIAYFKEIGWYRWLWWLAWLGTALLPGAYWNQILNGSWYGGGYPAMNKSINTISQTGLSLFSWHSLLNGSLLLDKLRLLKMTVFYFGYWPQQSWVVFQHYVLDMFPWLLPLAIVGIIIFIFSRRQWSKEKWIYLFTWLAVSVFLVLYYGSWKFNDNPDPNSFTIGNSYTRYWLPIYLGALPWAAEGLRKLIRWLFRRQVARPVIITVVAVICFWSVRFTAIGSEEGLIYSGQRQIDSYQLWRDVLLKTEKNSIIVTTYHDKLFFPERQVIIGLFDNEVMNQYYANLLKIRPVYYFNFSFQPADLQYLNDRRLAKFGYSLRELGRYEKFSLYKLDEDTKNRR